MSAVRPEFGPTLPEILRPRLRVLPRPIQAALAVVAAVVFAALLWFVLGRSGPEKRLVVDKPVAFNFLYTPPMQVRAPEAGELARVAAAGQSFTVRQLRLPPYRGDSSGFLPVYASQLATRMARTYPGFLVRSEGRVSVNQIAGYEMIFQTRIGGKLTYGRRIMLLAEPTAREGFDLLLLAQRSTAVPRADAMGRAGLLKTSLRTFRLGTP